MRVGEGWRPMVRDDGVRFDGHRPLAMWGIGVAHQLDAPGIWDAAELASTTERRNGAEQ
jgi:hypothetical protein